MTQQSDCVLHTDAAPRSLFSKVSLGLKSHLFNGFSSAGSRRTGIKKKAVELLQKESWHRIPKWPFVRCAKSTSLVRS